MPAFDYTLVARLYDEYCVFTDDIPFLVSQATACEGPVLELMAGTGRVSGPLAHAGVALTCLDSSPAMLAVLRRKLGGRGDACRIVCADVCQMPLQATFDCILLPFQGLSELVSEDDQRHLLRAVAQRLSPAGIFVCSLHNPRVRRRTLDGRWQELGVFPRPGGGALHLAMRGEPIPGTKTVAGKQRIAVRENDGATSGEDIVVELRFSLPEPDDLERWAEEAGLVLRHRWGDFAGGPWDELSSPAFVAVFGRRERASQIHENEGAPR